MSVKFYVSNLTFFFVSVSVAEPKYVKISMDGKDISDSRIGPYNEGQELRLLCESGGGKPIPRVTWYNGSEKLSGIIYYHQYHDMILIIVRRYIILFPLICICIKLYVT